MLDCTLRDGGYYNSWDFDEKFIEEYLVAMKSLNIDYVELGLRSFNQSGYKGACAYTTDSFVGSLNIPADMKLGVMVNASELINYPGGIIKALEKMFVHSQDSPISLVRIACHVQEFEIALPASKWLKDKGYIVGYNLMQIADRSMQEIKEIAFKASDYPLDVLYFADSLGSLNPEFTEKIIVAIKEGWKGSLGIHTHDNMGFALANSMKAVENGVTWIDGTVTGMGRGPGNAKTEYLALELEHRRKSRGNILPLLKLINSSFSNMQKKYGWGTNSYYYLAGKYGIHPTYIQEMINDNRYDEEDILGALETLKQEGGKKFSIEKMQGVRNYYLQHPKGNWKPSEEIDGKEVLILGSGPSVEKHSKALEDYININKPYVIALNTQSSINNQLINLRAATHPIRLSADAALHEQLNDPIAMPYSMLSENITKAYKNNIFDYGLNIQENTFEFNNHYCVLPNSLVITYALAIATTGKANKILLAGFDGYGLADERTIEVNKTLEIYNQLEGVPRLFSITPSEYNIEASSVYSL